VMHQWATMCRTSCCVVSSGSRELRPALKKPSHSLARSPGLSSEFNFVRHCQHRPELPCHRPELPELTEQLYDGSRCPLLPYRKVHLPE
jgi:hypothetical protein